tara:strand:- start:1703 stop:1885 length:183 start_codon:yes stop_codon:yes gene_type:complete
MFVFGGRRCHEISNLLQGQIFKLDPIDTENPAWPKGIPSMELKLSRTKISDTREDEIVYY